MIDISIIIPTYNRFWSLPKAIESCKSNICKIEVIVVDDGSTDETWDWLKNQEHVISIKQKNWGKCWAVNEAFKTAKGRYIKFLDSDDIINTYALDEQFTLAETENTDVVVSGYKLIDEKEKTLGEQRWIKCDDFIAQQLGECDSSHYSAYLFRKTFIEDIPHRADYSFRDDRLFVLEVAIKNPKISVHNGFGLLHRVHNNVRLQNTSKINKNIQNIQHLNIYKKIIAQLSIADQLNERRINASIKVLWPLAHWIAMDRIDEANEVVRWIYELNPNFRVPNNGFLGFLYNKMGFKTTEYILRLRRQFRISKN